MGKCMRQWRNSLMESRPRLGFPLMSYVGLELTGMNVLDVVNDGQKQAACLNALADRFPNSAGYITIMDLSVEAEAFGAEVKFERHETPTIIGKLVPDAAAAAELAVPEVGAGRTEVYLEAAAITAKTIMDKPMFGCVLGPFSLAGRLCGMTGIFTKLIEDPGMVHVVLEKCTSFLSRYAEAFKSAGTQGIFIAEPAAGLISPRQCQVFSSDYVKQIVSAVQDDTFMVGLHNCGNTKKLVPAMLSTGADGYHFGNAVDMADVLPQIPEGKLAFGNLDPSVIFRHGTPDEVRAKTQNLLERFSNYSNYIPSSGCDIPPGTPSINIQAFFAALEDTRGDVAMEFTREKT